jgi:uridine phosphorylase
MIKSQPIIEYFGDTPYITPKDTVSLKGANINTAIMTWLNADEIPEFTKKPYLNILGKSGRCPSFIYEKVIIVLMPVGAPVAAAAIEELAHLGVKNFIAFGTAGCIDPTLDTTKFFVVNRAIRDEGTSYHYIAPSIYVETDKDLTALIEKVLVSRGFCVVRGTTWTTDAIYRETLKAVAKRKKQGAQAVEMECAAFCAVAKKLGVKFGQFLLFSDAFTNEGWKDLSQNDRDRLAKREMISVALEIARGIK